MLIKDGFSQFQLLIFNSWNPVFMYFVSRISLKLIVGEFVFNRIFPTSEAAKDLIGLSLWKVFDFLFDGGVVFSFDWRLFLCGLYWFFLLLIFLFLLLFLLRVHLTPFLLLLFLVLRRVRLLLRLLLQLLALQFSLLLLLSQLHFVDSAIDYIII